MFPQLSVLCRSGSGSLQPQCAQDESTRTGEMTSHDDGP
jgi:hypothetical protein